MPSYGSFLSRLLFQESHKKELARPVSCRKRTQGLDCVFYVRSAMLCLDPALMVAELRSNTHRQAPPTRPPRRTHLVEYGTRMLPKSSVC